MNSSKQPVIRGFGQRSLTSSFLFHSLSSKESSKGDEAQTQTSKKTSLISLSDFLDRKLQKPSPKTVQGKQKPFSLAVGGGGTTGDIHEWNGIDREGDAATSLPIDGTVFEQFKHTRKEKEKENCDGSSLGDGVGVTSTNGGQDSVKQRNPFQLSSRGGNGRSIPASYLVVLGDDPKPKQKRREENHVRNKKPRHIYNHYANGSGWWDCGREGVDSEEVGCSEVWEGVGSTTLGGLEWH